VGSHPFVASSNAIYLATPLKILMTSDNTYLYFLFKPFVGEEITRVLATII
jgi:hypothetical protein